MNDPYTLIVLSSLALGLIAGAVMHRSDFCVTAMFRDFFLFRDTYMLRMLGLLVVVSMALFEVLRWTGLATPYPFPLLGPASLSNVLGGALFGVGMVLAGGCVIGTLYKMGSGSLLSALAFIGLLTGAALYAEIHPWWSRFAGATTVFPGRTTLPEVLGVDPILVIGPAVLAGALPLWAWQRRGALQRPAFAEGYLQPWRAALVLAAIGGLSYVVMGMPLGITTAYSKMGAWVESLFAPQHVAGLAYFQAVPLDYRPPFAAASIQGGAGPDLDAIAAIQYPLIFGVVAGAAVSALLLGELRLHWRMPARQYASAFVGGLTLGLAARMVPACNVWHLWGGLPILALQSLLFLLGLLPGAWLGSRLLVRFVTRT
ncbi:MAG: YeeE/YedE family protein [Chromatiales bacterium]|jgi:uncharacterized membrane protein YedE/YeeE